MCSVNFHLLCRSKFDFYKSKIVCVDLLKIFTWESDFSGNVSEMLTKSYFPPYLHIFFVFLIWGIKNNYY